MYLLQRGCTNDFLKTENYIIVWLSVVHFNNSTSSYSFWDTYLKLWDMIDIVHVICAELSKLWSERWGGAGDREKGSKTFVLTFHIKSNSTTSTTRSNIFFKPLSGRCGSGVIKGVWLRGHFYCTSSSLSPLHFRETYLKHWDMINIVHWVYTAHLFGYFISNRI